MSKHVISISKDKCIGCSMCVKDCPANNIRLKNKTACIISNDCVMCGHCAAVCPKGAVTISGYEEQPAEKSREIRLNPDDVLDTIRFRRTVRQFMNKEIPDSVLQQILEAGRLTHTEKNMQDVSFFVLKKEKSNLEQLAVNLFRKLKPFVNLFSPMSRRVGITDSSFFFNAPEVIVIASSSSINGALAAQNMEFAAEANGLGVLYSGFFTMAANSSRKIKKILDLPKGKKVITTLVLGYPKVKYHRSVQREKLNVKYL